MKIYACKDIESNQEITISCRTWSRALWNDGDQLLVGFSQQLEPAAKPKSDDITTKPVADAKIKVVDGEGI